MGVLRLVSPIFWYLSLSVSALRPCQGSEPRKKVHEHVAERLEIVAATLLLAQMCVDTHVASRAGQTLVLAVRYVLVGLRVDVGLGEAEVDDVHNVLATRRIAPDEEVLRLDVAVDQVLGMHVLHAREQLYRYHEHGLERELAVAQVEQVL